MQFLDRHKGGFSKGELKTFSDWGKIDQVCTFVDIGRRTLIAKTDFNLLSPLLCLILYMKHTPEYFNERSTSTTNDKYNAFCVGSGEYT